MKFIYSFIIVFFVVILVNSCGKIQSYSSIPHIDFKSYQLIETVDVLQNKQKTLVINFNFADGDGDLFDPDTVVDKNSPKSKLFLIFYQKIGGVFTLVPDSLLLTPLAFRLPYDPVMERNGQNKTQKGSIQYRYDFSYPMPFDTLEVKLFITDMAQHHSDTIQIPDEIALK